MRLFPAGRPARIRRLKDLNGSNYFAYAICSNTEVMGSGVKELKNLSCLTTLSLICTQVTDAGITNLERPQDSEKLYLGGTKIGDSDLKEPKVLKNLRVLDLSRTQITTRA